MPLPFLNPLIAALRSLGPAMAPARGIEPIRAAIGGFIGLGLCAAFLFSPVVDAGSGLFLIAPLGASAVLLFAVPNSPLAQPWSAVVGNTASGLTAWVVLEMVPYPPLAIGLAVGGAILVMQILRALHPPGGAVALLSALNAPLVLEMGPRFAIVAAGGGTLALVVIAILWNRLTGRHYPFRQAAPAPSADSPSVLGLSAEDLLRLLSDYRQEANLGPADLARLIGAAEGVAAGHRIGELRCDAVMARKLTPVSATADLDEIAALFRKHGAPALPVLGPEGEFLGLIRQIDLIRRLGGYRPAEPGIPALARLFRTQRPHHGPQADQILSHPARIARPEEPLARLIPALSASETPVPVVEKGKLRGLVSRADLLAALTHLPDLAAE